MKEKLSLFLTLIALALYIFSFNDKDIADSSAVPSTNELVKTEQKNLLASEKNSIDIFRQSVQSVVNVSNVKLMQRSIWNNDIVSVPAGSGSGFVWDKEGHIVTNFHVVQGGNRFYVSFHKDPKQYEATVVGAAASKDCAVLKIKNPPKNLRPVQVADSAKLSVGQKTLAIGNPFGLDHSLSQGIISALGRKILGVGEVEIHNVIQTDATINPGNSGGPLLNSLGQVIGMNTAIFSKSGSSSGIGFAVPSNTVSELVPQLIKHGKEIRPTIGFYLLDDQYKAQLGVENGVVVRSVIKGSPADKAGLRGLQQDRYGRVSLGDIIVAINKDKIKDFNDLYHILNKYKSGDEVKVSILRGRKVYQAKIKLSSNN